MVAVSSGRSRHSNDLQRNLLKANQGCVGREWTEPPIETLVIGTLSRERNCEWRKNEQ